MIETAWFFGDEDLNDAYTLRRAVFIGEQNIPEALEIDGTDGACAHLVAYDDGAPVATGRIMITRSEYRIGRVAVLKAYRGLGLGDFIMRLLIRACFMMGGEKQTVHAQLAVKGFYEKLGFTARGGVFDEAGVPHVLMEREGDIIPECNGGAAHV